MSTAADVRELVTSGQPIDPGELLTQPLLESHCLLVETDTDTHIAIGTDTDIDTDTAVPLNPQKFDSCVH